MRGVKRLAGAIVLGLLALGTSQGAEPQVEAASQRQTMPSNHLPGPEQEDDAARDAMLKKAELQRNTDRQKKLVADTAQLLALANELKADVDKSDKNTLSIDVIKKAEEIEKLAHSVKERMRTP